MYIMDLLEKPFVGSVIGIVGLLAATIFFFRSTKKRKLVYIHRESIVIGDVSGDLSNRLTVSFDEKPVERVTRAIFVIWNAGTEAIRNSDVAQGDPLRIEVPEEARVLLVSIGVSSRSATQAKCEIEHAHGGRSTVKLIFDFLDYRDGVNVSIVHSGTAGGCTLRGTVLGMPDGIRNWGLATQDLEAFRTQTPDRDWYWRILAGIAKTCFKWLLLLLPPTIIFCALFPEIALNIFPSLGSPDTTGVLVPGVVNRFWLGGGLLLLLGDALYFINVYQRPPKILTG